MVLSGQDAWRKHPLLSGNWKRPLPGLGMAAALFGVYLVFDFAWNKAMSPPPSITHGPAKYRFKESGDVGDSMPESISEKKHGGGHH